MANVTIVGDAVIHGIPNNGDRISITGYASFLLDKMEGEHGFDSYFTKDSDGNDAGATGYNEHCDITIDFTPDGVTRAAAAAIPAFPAPLAKITLANCQVAGQFSSSSAAIFNGDCLYTGGARINLQAVASGKMTGIKLRVYADPTQRALMTTVVVG